MTSETVTFWAPRRLLVVATGNITNAALLALFSEHPDAIVAAFDEVDFCRVETGRAGAARRARSGLKDRYTPDERAVSAT